MSGWWKSKKKYCKISEKVRYYSTTVNTTLKIVFRLLPLVIIIHAFHFWKGFMDEFRCFTIVYPIEFL